MCASSRSASATSARSARTRFGQLGVLLGAVLAVELGLEVVEQRLPAHGTGEKLGQHWTTPVDLVYRPASNDDERGYSVDRTTRPSPRGWVRLGVALLLLAAVGARLAVEAAGAWRGLGAGPGWGPDDVVVALAATAGAVVAAVLLVGAVTAAAALRCAVPAVRPRSRRPSCTGERRSSSA